MTEPGPEPNGAGSKPSTPTSNKSGWDGKLRVTKQATLANPEALSDPEYSDEDAPPVEQIEADEGILCDENVRVRPTLLNMIHRSTRRRRSRC